MEQPAPLDGTEWEEITEGSWFCGVYRYRFDFEAIIRLNENGRYEWATRLVTEASGEPDCEDSGDYALSPAPRRRCEPSLTSSWLFPPSRERRFARSHITLAHQSELPMPRNALLGTTTWVTPVSLNVFPRV